MCTSSQSKWWRKQKSGDQSASLRNRTITLTAVQCTQPGQAIRWRSRRSKLVIPKSMVLPSQRNLSCCGNHIGAQNSNNTKLQHRMTSYSCRVYQAILFNAFYIASLPVTTDYLWWFEIDVRQWFLYLHILMPEVFGYEWVFGDICNVWRANNGGWEIT